MSKFLTSIFIILTASVIYAATTIDCIRYGESWRYHIDARVVVLAGHHYAIASTCTDNTRGGVGISMLHAPSCPCHKTMLPVIPVASTNNVFATGSTTNTCSVSRT